MVEILLTRDGVPKFRTQNIERLAAAEAEKFLRTSQFGPYAYRCHVAHGSNEENKRILQYLRDVTNELVSETFVKATVQHILRGPPYVK